MGMNRERMGPTILSLRKYGAKSGEVHRHLFRKDGAKSIPRHCCWARGVLAVETEPLGSNVNHPSALVTLHL